MEEGTRIINLAPAETPITVSFEEAFGEYSELKGRGRKRRQKRRMERIKNKDERKRTRQSLKQERKTAKAAARGERRMMKKQSRLDRRSLGQEQDPEETNLQESYPVETGEGNYAKSPTYVPESQEESGGYVDAPSSGQGQYAPPQQEYVYDEEESFPEDEGDYEEEGYSEEEEGGDDDYGFDGVISSDAAFNDVANTVSTQVKDITRKIEWNKMLISKLQSQKSELQNKNQSTGEIDSAIAKRKSRIRELESLLKNYENSSDANGLSSRRREISRGRRLAKYERINRRNSKKESGGSETPVEIDLQPEITKNRIEIPAESNANGGYNLDSKCGDYDAPKNTVVELTSSAEGSAAKKMPIDWKYVVLGIAVAAAGIYAFNKFKKK